MVAAKTAATTIMNQRSIVWNRPGGGRVVKVRSRAERSSVLPHDRSPASRALQSRLGPDGDVRRSGREPAAGGREGGGGCGGRRAARLPPGAVPVAVLRAAGGPRAVRPGRACPGAEHGGVGEGGEAGGGRRDRARVRAPRRGPLPQ